MDHSVKAYIKRLPTELLKNLLEQICRGDFGNQYDHLILDILRETMKREKESEIIIQYYT